MYHVWWNLKTCCTQTGNGATVETAAKTFLVLDWKFCVRIRRKIDCSLTFSLEFSLPWSCACYGILRMLRSFGFTFDINNRSWPPFLQVCVTFKNFQLSRLRTVPASSRVSLQRSALVSSCQKWLYTENIHLAGGSPLLMLVSGLWRSDPLQRLVLCTVLCSQ